MRFRKTKRSGAGPQLPVQTHRDGLNTRARERSTQIIYIYKSTQSTCYNNKIGTGVESINALDVCKEKETRNVCVRAIKWCESVWKQQNSWSSDSPESQTYPVTTGAIFHKLSPKLQDSRDPLSQSLPAAETTEADWWSQERWRERKGAGDENRKRGAGWVKEKGRHHNNRRGKLFGSRESWKTLTIRLSERGSCHREIGVKRRGWMFLQRWSGAPTCLHAHKLPLLADLPRFFCRGSLRFPRLWCDKLRLWEMRL